MLHFSTDPNEQNSEATRKFAGLRLFHLCALSFALLLFCLHLISAPVASAAVNPRPLPQSFAGGAVQIGDEIYGEPGPQPVHCSNSAYQLAQTQLDTQRNA